MYAVLQISRLALQAVLRMAPEGELAGGEIERGEKPSSEKPAHLFWEAMVVVDAGEKQPRVVEMTEAAAREGVVVGLSIPQALARCEGLVVRHRSAQAEALVEELLFGLAYSLSPRVERSGPGSVLVDLRGAKWETTLERCVEIVAELAAMGLTASVGVAESFAVAELAAKEREGRVLLVEVRGSEVDQVEGSASPEASRHPVEWVSGDAFAAGLSLSAVEMGAGLRDVLDKWGVRTVGAFAKLKRPAVGARLGVEGLQLWDRLTGRERRVVAVAELSPEFVESWEFEYEVDSLDPILFLLRRFLDTLCARLRAAHKVAARLRLELELAYGEPMVVEQKLPEPTSDADALFRLFAGRLEGVEAESPVARAQLHIEAIDFKQRQLGLFESSLKNPYRFTRTLARVAGIVGAERVGRPVLDADGRPDGFSMEVLPASVPAKDELSLKSRYGMALRRFRPALSASVELQGRQPIWVQSAEVSGFIKAVRGPWMRSGHWWEEQGGWNRVEWDVELNKGGVYRLVKDESGWKVEGCYG